jgi:hypothetical protein
MAAKRTRAQPSKRSAGKGAAMKSLRRTARSSLAEGREAAELMERINRGLTEAEERADRLLKKLG